MTVTWPVWVLGTLLVATIAGCISLLSILITAKNKITEAEVDNRLAELQREHDRRCPSNKGVMMIKAHEASCKLKFDTVHGEFAHLSSELKEVKQALKALLDEQRAFMAQLISRQKDG